MPRVAVSRARQAAAFLSPCDQDRLFRAHSPAFDEAAPGA
jgi:hypothetical protein